jgi:predicted CXXCH cytochrome family protein
MFCRIITRLSFFLLPLVLLSGCAGTWQIQPIESFKPAEASPPSSLCKSCHPKQFETWQQTNHADQERMAKIPVVELHECGACHVNLASHAANPESRPLSVAKMSKTEQNMLCGKCHYSQQLFGSRAINPHDRHALFADVAFEGQPKQIGCLDCHSGHNDKSAMLIRIKAHICYQCHTSAMVTMGIFQPFNYVTNGYMCQGCHTVHGGSASERWGRMAVGFCVVCHFVGVSL